MGFDFWEVSCLKSKAKLETNVPSAVESGYCSARGVKSRQSWIPVGADEVNKSQVVTKSFIWKDCFKFMSYQHWQNPAICLWAQKLRLVFFMSFSNAEKLLLDKRICNSITTDGSCNKKPSIYYRSSFIFFLTIHESLPLIWRLLVYFYANTSEVLLCFTRSFCFMNLKVCFHSTTCLSAW